MSNVELRKQIARRQQAISRFEAKAARCNLATELGRAVAARAEKSAMHHRKHLEKLEDQMKTLGPDTLLFCNTTSI
jgi:hypothetical protein